jgi:hypothetical protein
VHLLSQPSHLHLLSTLLPTSQSQFPSQPISISCQPTSQHFPASQFHSTFLPACQPHLLPRPPLNPDGIAYRQTVDLPATCVRTGCTCFANFTALSAAFKPRRDCLSPNRGFASHVCTNRVYMFCQG